MSISPFRHRFLLCIAFTFFAFLGEAYLFSQDTWGQWISGGENIAAAKRMALLHDRPLLVVSGVLDCGHCGVLERTVLHTQAFLDFARRNKLVLFENRSMPQLSSLLRIAYSKQCGMNNTYPYVFLFKVNPDADLTKSNEFSLMPSEVSLLSVATGPYAGTFSGFNYVNATSINGVHIEKEPNWKPATFGQVLESFFPNQFWSSLAVSGGEEPPPGGGDDDDDEPLPPGDDDDDNNVQPPENGGGQIEIPIDDSEWGGVWLQPTQLAEAKAYALANNRPLLVVSGVLDCGHCGVLERTVLHTQEFLDYAREKKLVILENRSMPQLSSLLRIAYSKQCGMNNTYPYVFLFKVNPDADLTNSNEFSLMPSEVSLLSVATGPYAGTLSGFNYVNATSINGVRIEKEPNWKPATFIQVLESFFPNQFWNTISPPTQPVISGYENALDLEAIPSLENPPAEAKDWIKYSRNQSLLASSSERWYRFDGRAGRRYVFSARDLIPATTNVPITFSVYSSVGAGASLEPELPALFTVTAAGFDALDRGIQVDMPGAGAAEQVYFLRIKGALASNSPDLLYTLKVHEAVSAPPVGSSSNPQWEGAVPGQWTMDRQAAEAAALVDGRPVIYLFSGLLWCPYCVALEQQVLHTPAFAAATADAYLVMLDNRGRNGVGPSLLRDNANGGYLAVNSIAAGDAEAKLADNILTQDSLALPGADRWGPTDTEWKKIGYPTLLYRVPVNAGNTRAEAPQLVTVGRISGDYDPVTVVGKLADLAVLASDGFREDYKFASGSRPLPNSDTGSVSRIGGDLATADWWEFTVAADQTAVLTIAAENAPPAAMLTMTVYANDGLTALKTVSGSANQLLTMAFNPSGSETDTFKLKVSATQSSNSFSYTLTFQEMELNYRLQMAAAEMFVPRGQVEAKVVVQLQTINGNDNEVTFQYRVRAAAGETALPEMLFTTVDWTEISFTPAEKTAASKTLTANFTIPENATHWPDSRDFIVEIDAVTDGNCQIDSNASLTTIKVVSTALFAPRPEQLSFDLIQHLPVHDLIFPVCLGDPNATLLNEGDITLPPGLELVNKLNDPEFPCLEIIGAPTTLDAQGMTVELSLFTDMDYIDTLSLHFTVSEPPASAVIKGFAGYLTANYDDAAGLTVRGDIMLQNDLSAENSTITVRISTQETASDTVYTANGWSGYQPELNTLVLNLTHADNSALYLQVDSAGNGTGTYQSPSGNTYAICLSPVTDVPEQYVGYYTVALRQYFPDDETYAFHGWLQLTVAADGLVTYQGELIDATIINEKTTWLTTSVDNQGAETGTPYAEMIFYQSLYWSDSLNRWAGRLAGNLEVCPLAEREPADENDAWISACNSSAVNLPVWEKTATESVILDPCGTVFDAERSIVQQVEAEQPYFFFSFEKDYYAEAGVLLPNYILLEENRADDSLENKSEGIVATELQNLQYDRDTGIFTAQIQAWTLPAESEDGAFAKTELQELRGVLTPITSDCCRETANLAVGHGYFTMAGKSFVATLQTQAVLSADTPAVVHLEGQTGPELITVFSKPTVELTLSVPSQKVLRQQTDAAGEVKLFLHDWSAIPATPEMDFSLVTCQQAFSALENGKAESAVLLLPVRQATTLVTFTVPAAGEEPSGEPNVLAPGWHLLAIPWNVQLPFEYVPDTRFLSLHDDYLHYLPVSETGFGAGKAFWVFMLAGDTLSIPGAVLTEQDIIPQPTPNVYGWQFMANPGVELEGNAWFWNDGKFSGEANGAAIEANWRGVWFYNQAP